MLRTNSKKARENIRAYIIKHFEPYTEDEGTVNENEFTEAASYIYKTFYSEYRLFDKNTLRYYKTIQNAFENWAAGLPSVLDTCYYYNRSVVDDLGAILEETEAKKARYNETQAEQLLTRLIYREIIKQIQKGV